MTDTGRVLTDCCRKTLPDPVPGEGGAFDAHEAERSHDWIDTGADCCGSPIGWRYQACYCGAYRWKTWTVTAQDIADGAVNDTILARWYRDAELRTAFRDMVMRDRRLGLYPNP